MLYIEGVVLHSVQHQCLPSTGGVGKITVTKVHDNGVQFVRSSARNRMRWSQLIRSIYCIPISFALFLYPTGLGVLGDDAPRSVIFQTYYTQFPDPKSMTSIRHPSPQSLCSYTVQQKFRAAKQELEVQFDVEPVEMAEGTIPQCTPPLSDAIAILNSTEVRATAVGDKKGESGERAAGGDGGEGQKITPWEVEVRRR